MIKRFFSRFISSKDSESRSSKQSKRVDDAITFTLNRYGKTLTDLARYDRGEQLTNTNPVSR